MMISNRTIWDTPYLQTKRNYMQRAVQSRPPLRILTMKYVEFEEKEKEKENKMPTVKPIKMQGFSKDQQEKQQLKWPKIKFQKLANQFCKRISVHGMDHLFAETSTLLERFIWLVTVVAAIFGASYFSFLLSQRFSEGQLETVIDSTGTGIYTIPFPVITICNLNRLNWSRIHEAQEKFLPNENSTTKLNLFENVLSKFDNIYFGNFEQFADLDNASLHLFNDLNLTDIIEFMSWKCAELFQDCKFNFEPKNCCDIFVKRQSEYGICYSFNGVESIEGVHKIYQDDKYPWHSATYGPNSGLLTTIQLNVEHHYPLSAQEKGISVMITQQNSWHMEPLLIQANTKTYINLEPTIYYYDQSTRSISPHLRDCIFADEQLDSNVIYLEGFQYTKQNCIAECHQNYLIKLCNCTLDILFPPSKYPKCKIKDLTCLAQNNDYFVYEYQPEAKEFVKPRDKGMLCECASNCFRLLFIIDFQSLLLTPNDTDDNWIVDLDVNYNTDAMMVYRTNLVFGPMDLIVAFGGVIGLFLGCSLISAIEIIYFCLIDVPIFLISECRNQQHQQRQQQQQQQQPQMKIKSNEEIILGNYGLTNQKYNENIITKPKAYYKFNRVQARQPINFVKSLS